MGKPEGTVENHLKDEAEAHGCLCYKFTSPGNNGVPDRIVIGIDRFGVKHTDFIETKAPGEKPRLLQQIVHEEMRDHGATVYVLATKPAIDEYFRKFFTKEVKTNANEIPD